jgi:uncharacterized OB-fold protein
VSAAPAARPLPNPHEPAMEGFWQASVRNILVVQRCLDCGDVRFPPLPICPRCWSERQEWEPTAPTGTVYSYVVYHRALSAAFADEIPYAIGRVKITAGPIFTVRLDIPLDQIEVDMAVTASFRKMTEEISLVEFVKPDRSDG